MDESNLRDSTRKSNQVKNSETQVDLLGSYHPEKRLIIEAPAITGMTPTLRPSTSYVQGAAEPS